MAKVYNEEGEAILINKGQVDEFLKTGRYTATKDGEPLPASHSGETVSDEDAAELLYLDTVEQMMNRYDIEDSVAAQVVEHVANGHNEEKAIEIVQIMSDGETSLEQAIELLDED